MVNNKNFNNNFKILSFFLFFFIFILKINCQQVVNIVIKDLSVPLNINNNNDSIGDVYNKVPNSNSSYCDGFYFSFLAVDTVNIGNNKTIIALIADTSFTGNFTFLTNEIQNVSSEIFQLYFYNVPYGVYTNRVYSIFYPSFSYNFSFSCNELKGQNFIVNTINLSNENNKVYGLLKIDGLKYKLISFATINTQTFKYLSRNRYAVFPNNVSVNDPVKINLGALNSIQALNPPFENFTSLLDSKIEYYPSNGVYNEIGVGYSPLFKLNFKYTNSTSANKMPWLFNTGNNNNQMFPFPIYGQPGNYTYIGEMQRNIIPNAQSSTNIFIQGVSLFSFSLFIVEKLIFKLPLPSTVVDINITSDFSQIIDLIIYSKEAFDFSTFNYNLQNENMVSNWPFGFTKGNNKNFTLAYTLIYNKVYVSPIFISIYPYGQTPSQYSLVSSTLTPIENNSSISLYNSIHMYGFHYLIRIYSSVILDYGFFIINDKSYGYESLAYTNSLPAAVEVVINSLNYDSINITVFNKYGSNKTFNQGDFVSINPVSKIEELYSAVFDIYSINNIRFLSNNLNVTDRTIANKMSFDFTPAINVDTPIALKLLLSNYTSISSLFKVGDNGNEFDNLYYAKWKQTKNQFEIEFLIPKNIQIGRLQYQLIFDSNNFIKSSTLPAESQLNITASNYDGYGPIFKNINKLINKGTTFSFGWQFVIEDLINGFYYGDITVRGELDSSIYKYHITPANLTTGDKFVGTYTILHTFPFYCITQNYTITDVYLYDEAMNIAYFSINKQPINGEYNYFKNPFINFLGNNSINSVTMDCTGNSVIDTSPPVLTGFKKSQILGKGMALSFFFNVSDPESGLKNDQFPIVYISTRKLKVVECLGVLISHNNFNSSYSCEISIPFSFSQSGELLFSVYGIINNAGLYSGFSANDLNNLNFAMKVIIQGNSSSDHVSIKNTNSLSSSGGSLWVTGSSFQKNMDVLVSYKDDNYGFIIVETSYIYGTVLQITYIRPTNQSISIKIINNDIESNIYVVEPILFIYDSKDPIVEPTQTPSPSASQIPTQTPPQSSTPFQRCPGNTECGGTGKGLCENGQCICFSPWIGDDCSSKVIIVPQPSTNTSEPTTNIPITNGDVDSSDEKSIVLFNSLISLVSIRELNFNGEVENTYNFDKWVYSEISQSKNQYFTEIVGINGEGKKTNITVIIDWFNQSTIVNFAGQTLQMNPSTIKYTISIGEYQFSNQINQLQLVMSASFESSKSTNGICSNKNFIGSNNQQSNDNSDSSGLTSNYLKISIQDKSLYGRFIKRAVVDNKNITVSNQLLDSSMDAISNPSKSQSFIGITIPYFTKEVTLDPDFSVLVDNRQVSQDDNKSVCQNESSKLSKTQLVGIIIGGFAFVAGAVVCVCWYFYQKKRKLKLFSNLGNKLKNFSDK